MVNSLGSFALGAAALVSLAAQPAPKAKDEAGDDARVLSEAYSKGDMAVELCGLAGKDFAEFEAALARDPHFIEENSNALYRVYSAREPDLRILVIARERETAYPMAYCRTFLPNPDGTSRMVRDMHCEGEKTDCDAVFMEFYRHDQQILGS